MSDIWVYYFMSDTSDKTVLGATNQDSQTSENPELIDDDQTRIGTSVNYPDITDLKIYELIGKGGSGVVYKGRQDFLERDVAIKVLIINQNDEAFYKRFQREARILAKLSHSNIVSCYQAGMTNASNNLPSAPYIAMEFISGPSLSDWIDKQGKLSNILSLDIIIHIAEALSYALKQGIIHRDIKADNILLSPLNEKETVKNESQSFQYIPKLADLGIARTSHSDSSDDSEDLTQVGYMIGTPSHMAPEQFNQPELVDFKADIYGLGCVLYHMLTGKKLFKGKTLSDLIISKNTENVLEPTLMGSGLDPDIASLLTSMLEKDKDKRPASYEALIEQCQTILNRLQSGTPGKSLQKTQPFKLILFVFFIIITGIAAYFLINFESTVTVQQKTSQSAKGISPQQIQQQTSELAIEEVSPKSFDEAQKSTELPQHSIEKVLSEIKEKDLIKPESDKLVMTTENRPDSDISQPDVESIPLNMNDEPLRKNEINFTLSYMDKTKDWLSPGELYNILVSPEKDAYIYCYYKDQNNSIIRFYPNRFKTDAFMSANSVITLPGDMPFDLNASEMGVTEFITCFAFETNIEQKIPDDIWGVDFEPLNISSLQEIGDILLNSGYTVFSEQTLEVKVR